MKKFLKFGIVLALGALICLPGMALAYLVNFDDLSTPNNAGGALWGTVPTDYLGYTWTGDWEVQENDSFKSVYVNTGDFPSLDNAAYNDTGGATMTISFPDTVTISSAYFRSWGKNDAFKDLGGGYFSAQSLTINGYDGASLLYTMDVDLDPSDMVYTDIDFAGIDKIEFVTDSGGYWLVDNINVVPIPTSLLLLGSGLLGLIGVSRFRFRK
jgi:hypothetical protein